MNCSRKLIVNTRFSLSVLLSMLLLLRLFVHAGIAGGLVYHQEPEASLSANGITSSIAGGVSGTFTRDGQDPITQIRPEPPKPMRARDVLKWAVEYDDLELGRVEGVAYCNWDTPFVHVKLRNPLTGELHSLEAKGPEQIEWSGKDGDTVRLYLHGRSPYAKQVATPNTDNLVHIAAEDREAMKFASVDKEAAAQVRQSGIADRDFVKVQLQLEGFGSLVGRWSYVANPITERDADGFGRVGIYVPLGDGEIPLVPEGPVVRRGGFLGLQTGTETWTPLPARILNAKVLEDQAIDDSTHKQPHNIRTLVIVGRDLPVDPELPIWFLKTDERGELKRDEEGNPEKVKSSRLDALGGIRSENAGFTYEVTALAGAKNLPAEDAKRFEQVLKKWTKGMDEKSVAEFRKLDAVLVKVKFDLKADAGLKFFDWGGGQGPFAWVRPHPHHQCQKAGKQLADHPRSPYVGDICARRLLLW